MRRYNKSNNLYLAVTPDDYELPLAVARTPKELADITGVNVKKIREALSKKQSGKSIGYRFVKIPLEEVGNEQTV